MHTEAEVDLRWLAFRYIADEMSVAEAEAFEQRLAVDQAAREAVAGAVELAQAVSTVPADVIPLPVYDSPITTDRSPNRRWVRLAGWVAVAAAACLAAAMLLPGPKAALVRLFRAADDGSRESVLATLWASPELRDEQGELWNSELLLEPDDLVATSDLETESELTAPDWLLRAIRTEQEAPYPEADWEET